MYHDDIETNHKEIQSDNVRIKILFWVKNFCAKPFHLMMWGNSESYFSL